MTHSSRLYKWIAVLLIVILLPIRPAFADTKTNYSELYISISDSIMQTKKANDAEALAFLQEFEMIWQQQNLESSNFTKDIDQTLKQALQADSQTRGELLSSLSKALHELEKSGKSSGRTSRTREIRSIDGTGSDGIRRSYRVGFVRRN